MDNFSYRELLDEWQDEIRMGGIDVKELASGKTPLFVYDLQLIERKYLALRNRLSKNVKIFYAMKANANQYVAKKLADLGCGVDIASKGEFAVAKEAGFKNIIFSGPGKTIDAIKQVGSISSYHIESLNEAEKVATILPAQRIGVRVNASFQINKGVITTSGGCQKFGIDEEQIPLTIQKLKKLKIKSGGLHCYAASGVLDAKILSENARKIIELANKVEKACNITFEYIDIGGGIGVPYKKSDPLFDLDLFCNAVNAIAEGREIWIELGRFLVAECGVFLTRVVDVKESRGRAIAITDGGINNMLRPAILQQHPIVKVDELRPNRTEKYYVGGQLCTSLDFFAHDVKLPKLKEGDLLAILNAGAYGFSESMPFFLGHDIAGEIAIEKGKIKEIGKVSAEWYLLRR